MDHCQPFVPFGFMRHILVSLSVAYTGRRVCLPEKERTAKVIFWTSLD